MRHAIIGALIVLFLSVQSLAPAQYSVPSRDRTVKGIVTAVYPLYIQVTSVQGTKTFSYQFIIHPATKINGKILRGASVAVIYRIFRRSRGSHRNMASSITVIG